MFCFPSKERKVVYTQFCLSSHSLNFQERIRLGNPSMQFREDANRPCYSNNFTSYLALPLASKHYLKPCARLAAQHVIPFEKIKSAGNFQHFFTPETCSFSFSVKGVNAILSTSTQSSLYDLQIETLYPVTNCRGQVSGSIADSNIQPGGGKKDTVYKSAGLPSQPLSLPQSPL